MDGLMLARHIAEAASFFDTARSALTTDQHEAGTHVEHLHAAAQILAGDKVGEIYTPDGSFKSRTRYGALVQFGVFAPLNLVHWREADGDVSLAVELYEGAMGLHLHPTPTECRELAAALKQLADDADASAAQARDELSSVISLQQAAGQCVCGMV